MGAPLKVLIVEDSEDDSELLAHELRREGFDLSWTRVESEDALRAALEDDPWDVVTSDYDMPRLSAPKALEVLKESGRDIPFIVVSGVISMERAVDLMKAGADDFVEKNDLARLVPAVERGLRVAEERRGRKRAEEKLRASEQNYRALFENAAAGIGRSRITDGKVLLANRKLARMFGYERVEQFVAEFSFADHYVDPGERERLIALYKKDSDNTVEVSFATRDGSVVTVANQGWVDEKAGHIDFVMTDITERKRAEEALRESRARLIDAIESISEAFILFDADERFVLCNSKYREFYPQITDILKPGVKFEDVARIAFERGAVREAVGRVDEWTRKRLEQHRAGRGSHEQHLVDGRWIQASERRTAAGYIVGIGTDITALKEREKALRLRELRLRLLQTQLADMSRTSAMAQLSSELAHELNQPLTAVNNYLAALRKLIEAEQGAIFDKAAELANLAMDQAERANLIVRGLRNIVEGGETARTIEDLNETVEEAFSLALISPDQQGMGVSLKLCEALPPVRVNRVQIQQVVLNLVRNAVEAMERSETKELTVSTSLSENRIEVSVRDTGPGVSDEIATRLFQPFVSGEKDGMGIGLSICQSIVEAHDGRLELKERTNGGTTFSFTLPTATSSRGDDG